MDNFKDLLEDTNEVLPKIEKPKFVPERPPAPTKDEIEQIKADLKAKYGDDVFDRAKRGELDLTEDSLAPLVTKYHDIIRKSLYDLRDLAGANPKSQELIVKISGDVKKLTGLMKRDLKKR